LIIGLEAATLNVGEVIAKVFKLLAVTVLRSWPLLTVGVVNVPVPDLLAPEKVVTGPLKSCVVVVQSCPNELKEANDKAIAIKEKVKILLMRIKFKFRRFGCRPSVGKIGKDSQKVSVKTTVITKDKET
jgi:hypothetical protein